jgi:hypothetical protein
MQIQLKICIFYLKKILLLKFQANMSNKNEFKKILQYGNQLKQLELIL